MRIAEIIGTVTLNRCIPAFQGCRLRVAAPLSLDDLTQGTIPDADQTVVWDEMSAGLGDRIAMAEGPEASQPFRPEMKPVDAYNAAILDSIDIDHP